MSADQAGRGPRIGALPSYVCGSWREPTDEGRPVLDASTGEQVARISVEEVDAVAVLEYGRQVAAPAVRELTFHERAALLKDVASTVRRHRAELRALSARAGARPSDADYDIDGGLRALRSYAQMALRELPADTVVALGRGQPLARGGAEVGQRLATSRPGVALQVTGFALPVWAPLEAFARSLLAGMPTVLCPGRASAYVTARLVELIIQDDILPAGCLQLVCGPPTGLFDQVKPSDLVTVGGSPGSARLRSHPRLGREGVALELEAASLGCAILGPDASPGTAAFARFVERLVTGMTLRAGQTATAPRRAFVPVELLDDVSAAVAGRLATIQVGNPADPGVQMGPLVDLDHRSGVLRALAELKRAGTVVTGPLDGVGVLGGDAERGGFMPPVLLRADDPQLLEPHTVEAFGPVATLLPYRSVSDLVAAVALGPDGQVGCVVSADRALAREIVRRLAPWHDRVWIADPTDPTEATSAGSRGSARPDGPDADRLARVLSQMRHTTLAASPGILGAATDRWVPGAARTAAAEHPLRTPLDGLRVGDSVTAGPRTVTRADIARFAQLTGDSYYLHTDEAAAADNPLFGGIVAHGYLVVSLAAGLFVTPEPGPVVANYGLEHLRFLAPVHPGDELTVTLTAKQIAPPRGAHHYGEVRWDVEVTKQDDQVVAQYDQLTLMAVSRSRQAE